MSEQKVDYNAIVEEQAKLIQKRGHEKRKSLIAKDVQYFDSTELPKMLNQPKDTGNNEKLHQKK